MALLQDVVQLSVLSLLPSSHCSPASTVPSPQKLLATISPPLPVFKVQLVVQVALPEGPSSHFSPVSRLKLPQKGAAGMAVRVNTGVEVSKTSGGSACW